MRKSGIRNVPIVLEEGSKSERALYDVVKQRVETVVR